VRTVTLSDLTHTGVTVDANNIPLAVGYITAYAKAHLHDAIDIRLFKYPAALAEYLRHETPAVACFTNYMWNERLGCAFAKAIKAAHPQTVVVMGGPNYPVDEAEQHAWLRRHPEVDFFVDGEGEKPFVELYRALDAVAFDARALKSARVPIPSTHYVWEGELVRGELMPRILDLDRELPSPYLSGLLDEFFDDRLSAMLQTSRGCPYSCTFCHDGIAYMNKTRAFSISRVREELEYMRRRVKTPTLLVSDLNWGMFPADVEVARLIADLRREDGWPRNVACNTAKNQKDRVIEMSRVLGDLLQLGAAVQSTDPDVLRAIKRTNISTDAIVRMAQASSAARTGSFTEIILGLPLDTRDKHIKSVMDMLDAGIDDVRSFQFILLPGTEANDTESRDAYRYSTGFRVLARCFGRYSMYDREVDVAEVQEICLGNATMPPDDYFECRAFDLTVSIFNNGGVVREFFRVAETLGIRRSVLLNRIYRSVRESDGPLATLYRQFRDDETRNFFASREELEAFLEHPGTMDAYLGGEYGTNHIYMTRAIALMRHLSEVAAFAREALRAELSERGLLDSTLDLYLDELYDVIVASRTDVTELDRETTLHVHFDFVTLRENDFRMDPRTVSMRGALPLHVEYSSAQRADLNRFFKQFGRDMKGMAYLIQRNDVHLSAVLYRSLTWTTREQMTAAVIPTAVRRPA
jgi:radical SAM superfamily enzyme YgiQ (UPF0313 family)